MLAVNDAGTLEDDLLSKCYCPHQHKQARAGATTGACLGVIEGARAGCWATFLRFRRSAKQNKQNIASNLVGR